MLAIAIGLILIPLLDQAVKLLVRHGLDQGSIPLGSVGEVRVVQAEIWIARAHSRLSLPAMWIVWIAAAGTLAAIGSLVPGSGWFSGLLLGGSLSHAVETSLRGSVCDYVCLRFWPAFDLADVALAVGGGGLAVALLVVALGTVPS